METYKIYSGGEFLTSTNKLEVRNSFNNELIATTFLAGKEELEHSISAAHKIQKELKHLSSYKRYEILMTIAHSIEESKERLGKVLSLEACKPLKYAIGEIDRAIQTFIVAAEESKRLPKEYISLDWTKAGDHKEGLIKYFPIGLIVGIAPFNFPLNLAVHKIAPAIASGNPIILKPARSTPLSVLELAKIIDKTDLPKGAISILPMDRLAGNQLVTDERFKMLSFTGSPKVGWKMKTEAGKKKIALELGGNAGVIVTESAYINNAVDRCLLGSFAYSGQVCIHVQRIYVHSNIFDEFISSFVEKVKSLKTGEPDNIDTDISCMIDQQNAIRVENWVNDSLTEGAELICGGKRKGTYYEPTVLTNTNPKMNVCSLEIFGPVVNIEKYEHFEEAVKEINNSEYGLQAGVFTNNIKEMNYAFDEIEAGGVMINEVPTFRVDHMPYGGIKNSGYGREGIKYAIHEMMEPRLLVKNIL